MNLDIIIDALSVTAEAVGQTLSPAALVLMAQDLEADGVTDAAVLEALRKVRRECRRVTLHDILERLDSADGRPAADEAWTTALLALDESQTVIWTDETRQAFAIAKPCLDIHDRVGARMAFKAAYDRLLADARARRTRVEWTASLGQDVECRRIALESAVLAGKIPATQAAGLLPPPPANPAIAATVLQLACVNGEVVEPEIERREFVRRKIAELRAVLEKTA